MDKPTLDEFITAARGNGRNRNWVSEPKFESLYVRYGGRYIQGYPYGDVLDIANVTVEEEHRGQGVFSALIARLRKDYPDMSLYVENAMDIRFQNHLLKLKFLYVTNDSFFSVGIA